MRFHADNRMTLYFDGQDMGSADWDVARGELTVATAPRTVALRGVDSGGSCAVMLWMSNGYVTDTSWKCTSSNPSGGNSWYFAGYDDSAWQTPMTVQYSADSLLGCAGATPLWVNCGGCGSCSTIYCRKEFQ